MREQFESQFVYAPELFREVYDSDPVREKYPMLFLTARAPGHSEIGPQIHLDLAEANRRQLLAAGPWEIRHFSHRAVHGLPHGSLFLSPHRTGIYRTDDERHRRRLAWGVTEKQCPRGL